MTDDPVVLRDFVYLDWERIRSLAAQLFQGVPEDVRAETGSETAKQSRIEGGLPGVLKGNTGEDHRYFSTESETRSFHHHVYSLVESQLRVHGLCTEIGANFDSDLWTPEFFSDGQFVRVTGLLRLMDYDWVSTMMQALPKMMRAAQHAEELGVKGKVATGELSPQDALMVRQNQQRQLAGLKALNIDELADLIRRLYGDVVRVKVLSDRSNPQNVLVGSGKLDNFNESAASLSQKYGFEVDAGWVTLGQINISTQSAEPMPIPIGNAMEDAFEGLALMMNGIIRIASSVAFPAVSLTPIAIYRAIGKPRRS